MTSVKIRQSFLDFFREKKHTIVPSSSLMPEAPNLLFTNPDIGGNAAFADYLVTASISWRF